MIHERWFCPLWWDNPFDASWSSTQVYLKIGPEDVSLLAVRTGTKQRKLNNTIIMSLRWRSRRTGYCFFSCRLLLKRREMRREPRWLAFVFSWLSLLEENVYSLQPSITIVILSLILLTDSSLSVSFILPLLYIKNIAKNSQKVRGRRWQNINWDRGISLLSILVPPAKPFTEETTQNLSCSRVNALTLSTL